MADEDRSDAATIGTTARGDGAVEPPERDSLRLRQLELGAPTSLDARYERHGVLGVGGMGEVRLLADRKIGREVAIKLLRGGGVGRFLREARIQGQLEHPSIVPVYDVGLEADGQSFFTMKRVRGATLRDVVSRLAEGEMGARLEFTTHRLLSVFVQLCMGVDFAHSRGVIHRDIKPANVMLGDFGEVYMLDWGVAKVLGAAAEDSIDEPVTDIAHPERTAYGEAFGTPGYMAPEQWNGQPLDGRADVYALGAILFEMLTLQPLHPGNMEERRTSTLGGVDVAARVEAASVDVPAEMTSIVARATMLEARHRFPTARALAQAVEAFLSGDRDAEFRRTRSARHAHAASRAVEEVMSSDARPETRRAAIQEVSRALALDPANEEAMRAFVRLMTDVPRDAPPEVQRELDAEASAQRRLLSRVMPLIALAVPAFLPFAFWAGVRDMTALVVANVLWCFAVVVQLSWVRRGGAYVGFWPVACWCLALAAMSVFYGPFIVTPGLAFVVCASFTLNAPAQRRPVVLIGCILAIVVPAALQLLGLMAPSYAFEGGRMIVLPRVHAMTETPVYLTLLLGGIALIALPSILLGRYRDRMVESRKRELTMKWHLEQFLPTTRNALASDDVPESTGEAGEARRDSVGWAPEEPS